jgi:hypothetical protein
VLPSCGEGLVRSSGGDDAGVGPWPTAGPITGSAAVEVGTVEDTEFVPSGVGDTLRMTFPLHNSSPYVWSGAASGSTRYVLVLDGRVVATGGDEEPPRGAGVSDWLPGESAITSHVLDDDRACAGGALVAGEYELWAWTTVRATRPGHEPETFEVVHAPVTFTYTPTPVEG